MTHWRLTSSCSSIGIVNVPASSCAYPFFAAQSAGLIFEMEIGLGSVRTDSLS
jgi:hypothetical protein